MSTLTPNSARPRTIVEKIWDEHVVATGIDGAPDVLGIDLHLVHEVTSPQASDGLRARGLTVRRPGQTLATADHSIPTTDRSLPFADEVAFAQVNRLELNCNEFGIPLHGIGSPHQGIVHVIGPELGVTQPGMTIVCGDSHGHPRRLRRARVRDRHHRGRARPGHADAAPAASEVVRGARRRRAPPA